MPLSQLTHWGQVTHICVGNLTIIGSDNGLSPGRRQAIIWTNAGISSIEPDGTNCNEISIEIHTFSFKKMHLKRSSRKWRPFCLGFNVLNHELTGPSVFTSSWLRPCAVSNRYKVAESSTMAAHIFPATATNLSKGKYHDDVIKWKHFPRYWPFMQGNSPVNGEFPTQRPATRTFDVFLICAWIKDCVKIEMLVIWDARINGWVNNRDAGDLRRRRAHYDVTVM